MSSTTPTAVVQYIVELPEFKTRDKQHNQFFKNNPYFRQILQDGLCHLWNVQYGSLGRNQTDQVDHNVDYMAQHFPTWYKTYAHYSVIIFIWIIFQNFDDNELFQCSSLKLIKLSFSQIICQSYLYSSMALPYYAINLYSRAATI